MDTISIVPATGKAWRITLFNDGDVRKKLLCGVDMSRYYSNKARLIHFLRGKGVRGIHWQ